MNDLFGVTLIVGSGNQMLGIIDSKRDANIWSQSRIRIHSIDLLIYNNFFFPLIFFLPLNNTFLFSQNRKTNEDFRHKILDSYSLIRQMIRCIAFMHKLLN